MGLAARRTYKRWTPADDAQLLSLAHLSRTAIAKIMGRTACAVNMRRCMLAKPELYRGFHTDHRAREKSRDTKHQPTTHGRWTGGETATLVRLRESGSSNYEIAQILGRSVSSVKAKVLCLRHPEAIAARRRKAQADPETRARWAASRRAKRLTEPPKPRPTTKRNRLWSEAEVAFLLSAEDQSRAAIAKQLGRTERSVLAKLFQLHNPDKVRMRYKRRYVKRVKAEPPASRTGRWTKAELAQLLASRKAHVPFVDIARALGRTQTAVELKFYKLNRPELHQAALKRYYDKGGRAVMRVAARRRRYDDPELFRAKAREQHARGRARDLAFEQIRLTVQLQRSFGDADGSAADVSTVDKT